MSSVMAYFLLWMILIHKQECAVIRLDHRNRNAFEYVIQKYMNPLRRLSADLPNHAIEMEIEFHGTVPRAATQNPQRRVIRLKNQYQPKPIARSLQEAVVDPPALEAAETSTPAAAPESAPPTAAPPPQLAPPPGPTLFAPISRAEPESTDSSKIPVFMEDLQKALNDLEKRLATSSGSIANGSAVPSTSVRSIDDIVQMLKKGVHVEHRAPQAGDEKLEWVQIKIPKSMHLEK